MDQEDVEEEGNKNDNHFTSLKKMDYEIPLPYNETEWDDMIDYLDSDKHKNV